MASRYDVAGRLAEGREAVEHTQSYVSACRARGYRHPDLTAHGTQVRDWYDGEDGLDLRLLDADCGQLWAVANAAEEGLRVQRAQIGKLAAAWSGPGADTAGQFLHGHCDAGAALVAGLRGAAEACAALRDDLWRLVDEKVAAAVGIDDRVCGQRPAWLAAAHTVTAGTGDRQATEVIDQQVTPYVDNQIRTDWVNAMRAARSAGTAAYDTAATATAPPPGVVFPIPGELAPRYLTDEPDPVAPVVPVAPPVPSAAAADPLPERSEPAAPTVTPPGEPPLDAGQPADFGLPAGAGLPGGLGLPAGAGGLGGLIPRIADAIGGLLGSPDDGLADPGVDEPFDDKPEEADDKPEEAGDEPEEPADEIDEVDEAGPGDEPDDEPEEVAADPPAGNAVAAPADQQVDPPPPDTPAPAADTEAKTPCEIAADELPQVGQ